MPLCSAPGRSNRLDKGPEKHLSFRHSPLKNKKLAEKRLFQFRHDAHFMTKILENAYVCNVTNLLTETKCWVRRQLRKRRLKQDAVPKLFQCKVPLESHLNKPLKILRCSNTRNPFVSLPRNKMKIQTIEVKK